MPLSPSGIRIVLSSFHWIDGVETTGSCTAGSVSAGSVPVSGGGKLRSEVSMGGSVDCSVVSVSASEQASAIVDTAINRSTRIRHPGDFRVFFGGVGSDRRGEGVRVLPEDLLEDDVVYASPVPGTE